MNILRELELGGALLRNGHFVLTHGQHSSDFVRIDALVTKPEVVSKLCVELATQLIEVDAESVTACNDERCTLLARMLAEALDIEAAPAEKLNGKRTLIAEDVLTTGGSVIKLRQNAEAHGAEVVGVGVIWNRNFVTADQLGVPRLETLTDVQLPAFEADTCQLCDDQVPIVADIGRGALFRTSHPNYAGGYLNLL